MLSKSACLSSRLFSAPLVKTKITPISYFLVNSSLFSTKNLCPINPKLFKVNSQSFVTSSHGLFNKASDNIPIKSSSILQPSSSAPKISNDLKKILDNQNTVNDQNATQNTNVNESSSESNEDGSGMFSKKHAWKYSLGSFVLLFGGSFFYILFVWGQPKLDENNQPIKDEFSDLPIWTQYPKRAIQTVLAYYEALKDPSTEKLLPEPIQLPYYQPPYTLVIELTGLLLHPEWTFSTGWRYKKRPGLDYFLSQVKYPLFELVFFTKEPYLTGAAITNSLDPPGENQITNLKLYRESTKFINNSYVKDLTYMNRDPSKIIVIDWDEKAYQLQPRNALHRLKKWEGDENDTDLVYLASFLKMIASSGVSDVRDVLDYYNGEVDPLEAFKINQVKLQESEMKRQQEIEELKKKQKKSIFSSYRK